MRYEFYNECITATKEMGAGVKLDSDPLNIREILTDFTTILEVLHSETHDVKQRAIRLHPEPSGESQRLNLRKYSLV